MEKIKSFFAKVKYNFTKDISFVTGKLENFFGRIQKKLSNLGQKIGLNRKLDESKSNKNSTNPQKSISKKRKFFKKGLKIAGFTLVVISIILLTTVLILGLIFLRYRQGCQYQSLVDSGLITNSTQTAICPNVLEANNWKAIIKNAITFNPNDQFVISDNLDDERKTGYNGKCDDQTDPICWLEQLDGRLKQKNGYTNLLLVGTDSINGKIQGNTDSLMFVSFHHDTGGILLVSFPRDLIVNHTTPQGWYVKNRINAIYANYGVKGLNMAISEIMGKPIHYHAYISFKVFNKVVDKLGGIRIYLKKPFRDAYPCSSVPKGKCPNPVYLASGRYGVFKFPKGWNHFNSLEALVYARSRQYSSDYDRAARQQEVVKAALYTALEQDISIIERFETYTDIYNNLKSNMITNIQVQDIAGMFKVFDKISDNVAKVVIDPNLNGGQFVYSAGVDPVFKFSVKFRDYSYKSLQNYIAKIWRYLQFYIDKPRVLIINASGKNIPKTSSLGKLLKENPPYWKKKIATSKEDYTGLRIYDLSNGNKIESVRYLQQRLPEAFLYNAEIEGIKKTSYKENILIIVGK